MKTLFVNSGDNPYWQQRSVHSTKNIN
jgi:hypothetical protein